MKTVVAHIFLIATALSIGCSNYYRKADVGISPDDVYARLNSLASGTAGVGGGGSAQQIVEMASDSNAKTYYSEGPGPMGPALSIAALSDLSPFGLSGSADNIASVTVFFIDSPAWEMRAGLLVSIQTIDGQNTLASFMGSASTGKDGYSASMQGDYGTINVESFDAGSDGELQSVIQLKVYGANGYIGKFSTLAGFSH